MADYFHDWESVIDRDEYVCKTHGEKVNGMEIHEWRKSGDHPIRDSWRRASSDLEACNYVLSFRSKEK